MLRFLRAIRLDDADLEAYLNPAEPGEWAVPGSFKFLDDSAESLEGQRLAAFRHGFLGTRSFGWSSLVEVAEIGDDEYQEVVDRLAQHLVRHHGAPHIAAALPVAADEADYAASLCNHPLHTVLTLERRFGEDGIVESMKVVTPRDAGDHSGVRIWGADEG